MERNDSSILNSVIEAIKGDNGPVYCALMAIVAVVAARYGYRIVAKPDAVEVSVSPHIESNGNEVVMLEESE